MKVIHAVFLVLKPEGSELVKCLGRNQFHSRDGPWNARVRTVSL